jgi:hypothetical protein
MSGMAPTEQHRLVEAMAAGGMTQAEIAAAIVSGGLSLATLRRRFGAELAAGRARAKASVARSLYTQACKGNVAACKLWLDRFAAADSDQGVQDVIARLVAGARERLERKLAKLASPGGPAPPA